MLFFYVIDHDFSRFRTQRQALDSPFRYSSSPCDTQITLIYIVQADNHAKPMVIYGYGTEVPSSSAVDAHFVIHQEHGAFQFTLTDDPSTPTSLPSSPSPPPASSPSHHHDLPVDDIPLLRFQRFIVVHAVFCTLGFLIFLPAGILLARYCRTFTPAWFQGHWIVQLAIGLSYSYFLLYITILTRVQRGLLSLWVLYLVSSQFQ